jgi:hypothetical protein
MRNAFSGKPANIGDAGGSDCETIASGAYLN